jgi:hypothetical protein
MTSDDVRALVWDEHFTFMAGRDAGPFALMPAGMLGPSSHCGDSLLTRDQKRTNSRS